MRQMKRTICMAALIVSTISPPFAFAATQGGYSDVPSSDPYATYINDLQQKGVTGGDAGGQFDPTGAISRANFTLWMVKAFNLPLDTSHIHFTDLNGHPEAPYVQTAWDNGIVFGTGTYTFSPDAPISREGASTMIWRYLKAHGVQASIENFALPTTLDAWAREGVAQCEAKHLYGVPFTSGTFRDPLTREQAAALVDRAAQTADQAH